MDVNLMAGYVESCGLDHHGDISWGIAKGRRETHRTIHGDCPSLDQELNNKSLAFAPREYGDCTSQGVYAHHGLKSY